MGNRIVRVAVGRHLEIVPARASNRRVPPADRDESTALLPRVTRELDWRPPAGRLLDQHRRSSGAGWAVLMCAFIVAIFGAVYGAIVLLGYVLGS